MISLCLWGDGRMLGVMDDADDLKDAQPARGRVSMNAWHLPGGGLTEDWAERR